MTIDVLFLGGTGVISSACVKRAVDRGRNVTIMTRGRSARAPGPGVRTITADLRAEPGALAEVLEGQRFDVVVDVLGFTPEHIDAVSSALSGRCGQYVFLSSATVYSRPPESLPVPEHAARANPHWEYARQKIACEDVLRDRAAQGLPVTIVRPSHTYDATRPVTLGGWNDIARMRAGEPVIVHGDGSTLWTITHAADFAIGFDALLGEERAIGETFNVMGDEVLSWDRIYRLLAAAAGVDDPPLVRMPDRLIAEQDDWFGERILGDRGCSMTFDTSRLRRLAPSLQTTVPFESGVRDLVDHYDALPAEDRRDPAMDARIDAILRAQA